MRITIIGSTGSGKTTLAEKISKKFGVPHLQLDRLWFEAGGHKVKRKDKEGRDKIRPYIRNGVEKFMEQPSWVSDGCYFWIQPTIAEKADRIVHLDIPFYRRFWNHFVRIFTTEKHKELSWWDEMTFFGEMIRRKFTTDKKIHAFIKAHEAKVITLRSYKEVDRYIENLK